MQTFFYIICVPCLFLVLHALVKTSATNKRPMIGVMAETTRWHSDSPGDMFISAAYVKWLQAAGARVVPIKVKERKSYYEKMFMGLNGVLFPGGGVNILSSHYARAARYFYNMALRANDHGDYFPMWGTCLGFQLLTALTSGKNLLANRKANGMLPLRVTSGYQNSRLFKDLPKDIIQALITENVTANHHNYGLTITNYTRNKKLESFYHVLSTNTDENGKGFISTFEAYEYPFYGVQWHPEKNIYDWSLKDKINHDADAVRVSQYFANFLVAESRRSDHSFGSLEEEISLVIDNYNPIFSKNEVFSDTYYFNFTCTAVPKH